MGKTDCFFIYNKFPLFLQYLSAYGGLVQCLAFFHIESSGHRIFADFSHLRLMCKGLFLNPGWLVGLLTLGAGLWQEA